MIPQDIKGAHTRALLSKATKIAHPSQAILCSSHAGHRLKHSPTTLVQHSLLDSTTQAFKMAQIAKKCEGIHCPIRSWSSPWCGFNLWMLHVWNPYTVTGMSWECLCLLQDSQHPREPRTWVGARGIYQTQMTKRTGVQTLLTLTTDITTTNCSLPVYSKRYINKDGEGLDSVLN